MNGYNYEGKKFKILKDMNKGGKEEKLYEAAGNFRRSAVRQCPTSGACESEEQPLQELLNHMSIKSSQESIKKTVRWS